MSLWRIRLPANVPGGRKVGLKGNQIHSKAKWPLHIEVSARIARCIRREDRRRKPKTVTVCEKAEPVESFLYLEIKLSDS